MAPSLYDSDDDDDEDDSSSHGQPDVSESEKFYVSKGNDKRILICLCIGLKGADGQPLIDTDKDPWAKQAANVRKPKMAEHLKPEILRRSSSFVTFGSKSAPRPGQWNLEKCMEWLHAYPIIDSDCKEFLRLEALRVTKILKVDVQEKDAKASAIRLDKYELFASTVTELSAGVGAVDANAVPAAITNGGCDSSASKRKRTPRRRRRGSRKMDNDSASSGGSSGTRKKNADAELTSALVTLGNETKMSRIGRHIGALRKDARSINRRIAELKQSIHQYQIDAMETKSQDKRAMYMAFITDYTTELNDLKSQLDDIAETVKEQEQKLDD
jgi:hypothetical protein